MELQFDLLLSDCHLINSQALSLVFAEDEHLPNL